MSDKYKSIDEKLQPFANNGGSVLPARQSMAMGQYLSSPSGRYQLIYQGDGNLALYDAGQAIWVANKDTSYSHEYYPKVWGKYEASKVYLDYELFLKDVVHRRIWNTVNTDVPGDGVAAAARRAFLQVQDDGNMVIVDAFPHWSAPGTTVLNPAMAATIIPGGTTINPGDSFAIGKSHLVFQEDGNLVFYGENNRVLWASYTSNRGGAYAAMQGDGNFVIYNAANQPVWYTSTGGHPDAYLRIQENGSFAIVSDRVCWARFGFTPTVKPARKIVRISGNPYTEEWKTKDHTFWTF